MSSTSSISVRHRYAGLGLFMLVAVSAVAQAPLAESVREFPPGSFSRFDELPSGRFRSSLEQLPAPAQERARNWLRRVHFTTADVASLHADSEGGICFACAFPRLSAAADGTEQGDPPPVAQAAVPVSPFPASLKFHSRPGAPNVLYIEFSGMTVTNSIWNSEVGRTSIPAMAFSTDSDYSTFSDSEQIAIKRIWQRMAEDFAPFNIDVTTERPATFNNRTAVALITRNTDATGAANPYSTAGGVAYVDVFNLGSFNYYRPAWIYQNNLGNSESYIAEAASHEIGHNLGLNHDGTTSGSEYYAGHGGDDDANQISWGPIMGTGYNRNVSQWSKGEYYNANNTQDDLVTIAGKISYRTDDHGNTSGTATALVITGITNIVSTTPENDPANTSSANKGVLSTNTDVDAFSFVTGSGAVRLAVNPWIMPAIYPGGNYRGGNLDVSIELYNSSGTRIATNNPSTQTTALIQTNLSPGVYYLHVRNSGAGSPLSSSPSGYTAYASIGQYFISGYVTDPAALPSAVLSASDLTQSGQATHCFSVTYADYSGINVATIDSNDVRVTGPNGYEQLAQLVSLDLNGNGSPRTATYAVSAPSGGSWSPADNGVYTVYMRTNQVADTGGAFVAPGVLGEFNVSVMIGLYSASMSVDPGWTLDPDWEYGAPEYSGGPTSGYTGQNILGYNLSGNYPNNLPPKYATTPVIDTSGSTSVNLRFRRWLVLRSSDTASIQVSTNGTDWAEIWSTTSSVTDSGWQLIQYPLPAGFAGSASVRVRWGLASNNRFSDIGWNLDDVELLGNALLPASQYQLNLSANNPAWGSVAPTNGSYPQGSLLELRAIPTNYFQFAGWTGGIAGPANPTNIQLNASLTAQAMFSEILTTNHPTPLWWLASQGFTNDFEMAVSEIGANGMPMWQSYVAGLNPSDPASRLILTGTPSASGTGLVLDWATVTGRTYSIWVSTSAGGDFQILPGSLDLPWTVQSITNPVNPENPIHLFRLQVKKP